MLDRLLPRSPRARSAALSLASVVIVLLLTQVVFPGSPGTSGRGTPLALVFAGVVKGMVTALTAVGFVLIYRTIRIINFAQTAIGAGGAAFVFEMVRYVPAVPFPVTLVLGIAFGALTGALFDLALGRRFFDSPRLVLTVVTIAGASFLGGFSASLIRLLPWFPPLAERSLEDLASIDGLRPFLPLRGFDFNIGGFPTKFGFPEVLALDAAIVALILVALFFRYTKTGVGVRALAENSDRAKLVGISVGAMTTIVWIIAGALSALSVSLSGVLANPAAAFGFAPTLLLPALAAAVVARMERIPVAVLTAVLLSVMSSALSWSFPEQQSWVYNAGLFLVVAVGLLLVQRRQSGRSEQATTSWQATEEQRPIPKELSSIGVVRALRVVLLLVFVAALGLLPFVGSTRQIVLGGVIAINAMVACSLVVLTGWAGQVSLGQYGFVAVGAVVGGALTSRVGLPFWVAAPVTMVFTAAFAAIVGLPALRVRGLFLAVTTFAFAIAVRATLFDRKLFGWLLPEQVERPTLFFLDFEDEKSMYFLCILGLLLTLAAIVNLRRSRTGRNLIAMRENEANLQAFGISVLRTKLTAFAIAGAVAGLAGVLFAHQQRAVNGESFGVEASFILFVATVIGGVGSLGGGLLGAAYVNLVQYFLQGNLVFGVIAGIAPLIILYVAPGGLVSIAIGVRDSFLRIVAQRRQLIVPSLFADFDAEAHQRRLVPLAEPMSGSGLLALRDDQRFTKRSELYQGHGERIVDRLGPAQQTEEAAAIGAAAERSAVLEIVGSTPGSDA